MKLKNKKKIDESKYVLNDQEMDKLEVIKHISNWARESFIFHNRQVYLPNDVDMPVQGINEELTNADKFIEETKLGALEYLITCVLSIGIKIGREMEKRERDDK